MLVVLAQAAEPPPSGWEHATDFAVKTTAAQPNVVFPLIACFGFLMIIVGAGYLLVKYALPAWRAEKAADREHLSALVAQRGKEALDDVAAGRELAKAQHSAIVTAIGDRVDRVTGEIAKLVERSEKHGDLLRSVASKIGVGLLVLVLLALGVMQGAAFVAQQSEPAVRCDPPCPSGQRCTVNGCKEVKTTTATTQPHSSLRLRGFANLAGDSCLPREFVCP